MKTSRTKELSTKDFYFRPGQFWQDTDGNRIEAHGGGILLKDGVYYWYGENRSKCLSNYTSTVVSGYASRDLYQWKSLGNVLSHEEVPAKFYDSQRPKVIYNPATKRYVMWIHMWGGAQGDTEASAGVAISEAPEGPFRFLKDFRPIKYDFGAEENDPNQQKERGPTFRDMNLFVDDDGSAYVVYAAENNLTMYIARLNREFTGVEEPSVEGKTWSRNFVHMDREAPAIFKFRSKYYMVNSGCTGWAPNPIIYGVADHILGPWKVCGKPCFGPGEETSFRSQSTFVIPAPGKPAGSFIYMGDRWNGNRLVDSTHIWLPFVIKKNGTLSLEFIEKWNLSIFDSKKASLEGPVVKSVGGKTVTWRGITGAHAYRIYQNGLYIGITTETHFELPAVLAGRSHAYAVSAMTIQGKSSPLSKAVLLESSKPRDMWLSDIKPESWFQGYGTLGKDLTLVGTPLTIGKKVFKKGLGTHAHSEIVFGLAGKYSHFQAFAGLDAAINDGSAEFLVYGDGALLYRSGKMVPADPAKKVRVSVEDVGELRLVVADAGEGIYHAWSNWADACLIA